MTDLDHTALEAAALAATQGEWRREEPATHLVRSAEGRDLLLADPSFHCGVEQGDANAAYIVAAQPSVILALLEERKRLEGLVYVPGLWRCPKCKFSLLQRRLNAADGTITARDQPGDKCPNCAGPLWRVSEREAGNEMIDRANEAYEAKRAAEARADDAAAERDRMRKALRVLVLDARPANWNDGDDENAECAWRLADAALAEKEPKP